MKLYVTIAGKEFTVELEGDRAVVRENGEAHEVRLVPPGPRSALSEVAAALVDPSSAGPSSAGPPPSSGARLQVSCWGHAPGQPSDKKLRLVAGGRPVDAVIETDKDRLRSRLVAAPRARERVSIDSPLSGIIRRVFVFPGNEVRAGDAILTLEAMKMENEIRPDVDGVLEALFVEEGQIVNAGDRLCEVRVSSPGG